MKLVLLERVRGTEKANVADDLSRNILISLSADLERKTPQLVKHTKGLLFPSDTNKLS